MDQRSEIIPVTRYRSVEGTGQTDDEFFVIIIFRLSLRSNRRVYFVVCSLVYLNCYCYYYYCIINTFLKYLRRLPSTRPACARWPFETTRPGTCTVTT
jgi:hypothetical protein